MPINLTPFRQYHLSLWIKTDGFNAANNTRVQLLTEDGRSLNYADLRVRDTQDWTQHHVVFNSLNYEQARLYIGTWSGRDGTMWVDGVTLDEVGLLHVLRRDGCPLVVASEDDEPYEEGRDFERVEDPDLARTGYHDPPLIVLTPDSRIRDGERVNVSYYHALHVYSSQRSASLLEPEVYTLLQDQAQRVNDLFHPTAFMMNHDEIRTGGWDALDVASGRTPGEVLAENVRRCEQFLRDVNPDARLYVWNDMFDPHHNARDNYYLVNGTWEGSWEGLSPETIIVNWYYGKRLDNMPWFAERRHKQLMAGYYDGDPTRIKTWIDDARRLNIPLDGVMYTTWERKYDDLEAFAEAGWGGKPTGESKEDGR